jgi:tetratricopeptide (TPR) repeat protein
MKFLEILYCILLGICNLIILVRIIILGRSNALVQDILTGTIKRATFFGLLLTIIGVIAYHTIEFRPDIKNPLIWIIVFGIPFLLAIIVRMSVPRGWKNLQSGKKIWQKLPLEYNRYGVINENAYNFQSNQNIQLAENLIKRAIDESPTKTDRAIAYQELGLLYRAINKFDQARNEYEKSLNLLNELGGSSSKDRKILSTCRDVLFRIAELDHALGNYKNAKNNYSVVLQLDKLLKHDDPIGENTTRILLNQIDRKLEN